MILRTLPDRAIWLRGSDALSWLQGQCTQDLGRFAETEHLPTCFCRPTGQLLAIAHLYQQADGILIITDRPQVVLNLVDEFVIMEDVEAKLDERPLASVQGAGWGEDLNVRYRFERDRTGFGGFDAFATFECPLAELDPAHLDMLEIAAGIPRPGVDTNEKALPPELGPRFDQTYIHYQKGCYTGQEVLQRIHSRGHTNRTWVGLRSESLVPAGAELVHEGQVVGTVLRSALHPELGAIGTAMVRNAAAQAGTELQAGLEPVVVSEFPIT